MIFYSHHIPDDRRKWNEIQKIKIKCRNMWTEKWFFKQNRFGPHAKLTNVKRLPVSCSSQFQKYRTTNNK